VRHLVPDEYLGNRWSHGAQRVIGGRKFTICGQNGKDLWGRFDERRWIGACWFYSPRGRGA